MVDLLTLQQVCTIDPRLRALPGVSAPLDEIAQWGSLVETSGGASWLNCRNCSRQLCRPADRSRWSFRGVTFRLILLSSRRRILALFVAHDQAPARDGDRCFARVIYKTRCSSSSAVRCWRFRYRIGRTRSAPLMSGLVIRHPSWLALG